MTETFIMLYHADSTQLAAEFLKSLQQDTQDSQAKDEATSLYLQLQ